MAEKACEGGRTLGADNDMEECVHCGSAVRWDLVDHPFFGFKASCPQQPQPGSGDDAAQQK